MDLRSYLGAIRKSWWIVALAFLLGATAGFVQSKRSTQIYAGHVTFYVATPALSGTSALGSDQFAQDRANTYAQLLSSERLAAMIISAEGLNMRPADLAHEMSGAAELNTVLVKATIKDSSLPRLRIITTAVGKEFPTMVDELDNSGTAASAVRLSVVSGPAVSSSPVSPRTSLNVALGAALGLLLGLLLAALREVLDVSIRTSEALRDFGQAPVIGVINLDSAAKRAPLVVGDQAHSIRAEAFRQLRTNVRLPRRRRSGTGACRYLLGRERGQVHDRVESRAGVRRDGRQGLAGRRGSAAVADRRLPGHRGAWSASPTFSSAAPHSTTPCRPGEVTASLSCRVARPRRTRPDCSAPRPCTT